MRLMLRFNATADAQAAIQTLRAFTEHPRHRCRAARWRSRGRQHESERKLGAETEMVGEQADQNGARDHDGDGKQHGNPL